MKNYLSLALALILSLVMVCCPVSLAGAVPAEDAAPETAAAPLPMPAPDAVLAIVNGQDVTYAQVAKYYESMMQQYSQMMDVSDPQIDSVLRTASLNYAVTESVILQKAKELGFDNFSEEELAAYKQEAEMQFHSVAEQYKAMFASDASSDEEQLAASEAFLASNGFTVDTVYEQLINNDLYLRVTTDASKDVAVTDEQVKAEFDKNVESAKATYEADITQYDTAAMNGSVIYYVPEGVRAVKHILIKIDTGLAAEIKSQRDQLAEMAEDDAARADAQAKLDALMVDVQPRLDEVETKIQAGEDFQSLIDTYGEDPGMQEGSPYKDTGYYLNASTVVFEQPFAQAAMALEKVGDISEPVLGSRGFHIVRYDHDVASGPVDFETTKDALRESTLTAAKQQAEGDAVESWVKAANVELFLDRFGMTPEEPAAVEATEAAEFIEATDTVEPTEAAESAEAAEAAEPAEATEPAESAQP